MLDTLTTFKEPFLPLRTKQLLAPRLLFPETKRMVLWVYLGLGIACVLAGATIATKPLPDTWFLQGIGWLCLLTLMFWLMENKVPRWIDGSLHRREVYKIGRTEDGRDLLLEGDSLYEGRERLLVETRSTHPILSPDALAAVWDEQLVLEQKLQARQNTHLCSLTNTSGS